MTGVPYRPHKRSVRVTEIELEVESVFPAPQRRIRPERKRIAQLAEKVPDIASVDLVRNHHDEEENENFPDRDGQVRLDRKSVV